MNTADRFANAISRNNNHTQSIAVPRSPSASATRMANQIGRERQQDKDEARGEVTPSAIRTSMPPIRDIEFEYLKKFQNDLFRIIVKAKSQGLFHAEFTVTSRDIDEYTLDFIFTKFVAVLRHQKFFVALGSNLPRSFVVSWDPILCPDSITPEEMNNPNSVASIRTRRYARLQRKYETLAQDERETNRQFQEYLNIMNNEKTLKPIVATSATMNNNNNVGVSPLSEQTHILEIGKEAKAKAMLMQDVLNMSRLQQYETIPTQQHPLLPTTTDDVGNEKHDDTIQMILAADNVAAVANDDDTTDVLENQ